MAQKMNRVPGLMHKYVVVSRVAPVCFWYYLGKRGEVTHSVNRYLVSVIHDLKVQVELAPSPMDYVTASCGLLIQC